MGRRRRQYEYAQQHTQPQTQTRTEISQYSRPFPKPQPLQAKEDKQRVIPLAQSPAWNLLDCVKASPAQTLPIMPKLTIGAVGNKYEQEADAVATQVVQQLNHPQPAPVQRDAPEEEEDNLLQQKPLRSQIQRTEGYEDEEEEIRMKPLGNRVQRTEGYEDEEEEIRMKPLGNVMQLRGDYGSEAASPDLERSIQRERGKGQPMAEGVRQPMESAFGVDFGGVRIHTDNTADQLNHSIQAKAFTTGQDVFFRQGAYAPESKGGQALLAHELTHVVQQGGSVSEMISRKLSVENTQWDRVRQIYSSEKGGGGVLMFSDKEGEHQLIVKPGIQGAEETAMAALMSGVNNNKDKWQIGTPDVRIMGADEAQNMAKQMQKAAVTENIAIKGRRTMSLLGRIAIGGQDVMVTSMAKGEEFGDMLTDTRGQDHITTGEQRIASSKSKVKKDSPLKLLMDNAFMMALGRMAAVDIFLGNWDRLADKFNPENLFIRKKFSGGTITGIDNSGEVGMLASQNSSLNAWLGHYSNLPQMMVDGDYIGVANALLLTNEMGIAILPTLVNTLLDTGGAHNYGYDYGEGDIPELKIGRGPAKKPQAVAIQDKLNTHMEEMAFCTAQGVAQGVERLKNLPQLDLTNYTNGGLAQQNYIDRLNALA
ncbi:MAG: DUF4157 domain-containing protein [Cyanobacteria bacterium P01_G01_bin.54]